MEYGGWTGKVLRVDLTTGIITKEDTDKYKDYLGGTGLGYKVLWDEVPPGTKAWDPENRLVFGVGPLTGTGAPLSARVSITSLYPVHVDELPATGHMGGHWGPELKFAGYDSLIVQGKSPVPVWIYIKDDVVEIRDAGRMWGNGIYRATSDIMNIMGPDAHVAAIGQAGENLVPLSNIMCDRSHSAGGMGSVMGSKNLKAIGIIGTGALKIAADKQEWKDIVHLHHTILGANSGGVVPNKPQAWQPDGYYGGTRWTAAAGVYWGAATPPVETGDCTAEDLNSIGLRTHKGYADFGAGVGDKHTVKIQGCHACPIRCHIATDVPALEQYGVSRYQVNTCTGNSSVSGFLLNVPSRSEANITASQLSVALADDYGFWNDYGQIARSFKYCYQHVLTVEEDPVNAGMTIFQKYLPAAEYAAIPWALMEAGDPAFMLDLVPRLAYKTGVMGAGIGEGPMRMERLWPELAAAHNHVSSLQCVKMGHAKHHFVENGGQVGALLNLIYNRDPMCHTHTNFFGTGLPLSLKNDIFNEFFGSEFVGSADAIENYTDLHPMNQAKAVYVKLCLIYMELHNSMTLCNYTLPTWASPLKSRNYRGDVEMEAKLYSAVTGDAVTRQQLEDTGLRILTLFRALTARYMETAQPGTGRDQRTNHDIMPDWTFEYPPAAVPFTPGNYKMDRADMELAKELLYEQLGWDKTTGLPTQATYDRLGLSGVATAMAAAGLMP